MKKNRLEFSQSRRAFLRQSGRLVSAVGAAATLAPFGAVNALAQGGDDYKAIVCIFNFGGNDANNMIVPMGANYGAYKGIRQSLALPEASLLPTPTAQGTPFGLHASLAPIHPLYASKKLALIANVGMLVRPLTREQYRSGAVPAPSNLFSHSDQQQQWQNASPLVPASTGWSGRMADRVQSLNAPSIFPPSVAASGNSLQLIGQETRPTAIGGKDFGISGNDQSVVSNARQASLQEMLKFDSGLALYQTANRILSDALAVSKLLEDATRGASTLTTAFPTSGLGQQLAQVARIIQVRQSLGMRRQIFFVSQGGFDTHSAQLGMHAALMSELSQAMLAFYNATVEMGIADKVVTFTESEFNRTFQPNGNVGSDHAWGTHTLVMGGGVLGGDMYGTFPTHALQGPSDSGDRGNWIPTTSLDQYGATMAQWFGVNPLDLSLVFPNLANFTKKTMGFLPGT